MREREKESVSVCVCARSFISFPSSQNVLRKVQHQDALQISDVVMASLLRMFQSTAGSGGVQEDALMAVSTLVEGEGLQHAAVFSLAHCCCFCEHRFKGLTFSCKHSSGGQH